MDERNDYNSIPAVFKMETTQTIIKNKNKMKTPMQKAIDKVSFVRNMCNDDNNEMTIKHVLDTLKEDLNKLLEEEKEQIKRAFKDQHDLRHLYSLDGEDYYNDKYNKNK